MSDIVPHEVDPSAAPPVRPVEEMHLTGHLEAQDEGIFSSLVSSVRDVFFPVKLPPLVLESKPVPVVDRMAVKRDPKATAIAIVINGSILLLVLWWGAHKVGIIKTAPTQIVSLDAPPPPAPPKATVMGGGGGQKGPTPVTKGNPPKFAPEQIVPPKAPPLEQPKIAVDPTVNVQQDLKMAHVDVPQFGVPNSPLVGMSMGNGSGGGLGSGNGNGIGPGSGGNMGGGVMRIGGGVSAPVILFQPEPEFSEEARKAKVAGNVLVYLQVDQTGTPTHVHVIRGIGLGLDEKAVDAVKRYKFKPAMKDGKPVVVEMNVEVNFQIF